MDPDLLERMCKKISQLTRVIYLLNTKNEESESLIKGILSSNEKDMDNLRREANSVIDQMKDKIDKLKDTSYVDSKLKDIKRKYDDTVLKYSAGFESFKADIKKSKDALNLEYRDKYNEMIKEVSDIKKAADKKISDFMKKSEDEKMRLVEENTGCRISEHMINEITEDRLRDEVKKGVQTIQYQVVTLLTTTGQAPFITVFMYLGETDDPQTKNDLAMIIEEVLV